MSAQPCKHQADQRWVIGDGIIRLAGTRLRLVISRKTWETVLVSPSGKWHDGWKLDRRHHVRDTVLSRRFKAAEVLTLPTDQHGHPLPGAVMRDGELQHPVHAPGRDVIPGDQRVRLIRVAG